MSSGALCLKAVSLVPHLNANRYRATQPRNVVIYCRAASNFFDLLHSSVCRKTTFWLTTKKLGLSNHQPFLEQPNLEIGYLGIFPPTPGRFKFSCLNYCRSWIFRDICYFQLTDQKSNSQLVQGSSPSQCKGIARTCFLWGEITPQSWFLRVDNQHGLMEAKLTSCVFTSCISVKNIKVYFFVLIN